MLKKLYTNITVLIAKPVVSKAKCLVQAYPLIYITCNSPCLKKILIAKEVLSSLWLNHGVHPSLVAHAPLPAVQAEPEASLLPDQLTNNAIQHPGYFFIPRPNCWGQQVTRALFSLTSSTKTQCDSGVLNNLPRRDTSRTLIL